MVDAVVYPEASAPDGPANPMMMRMVQHAVDRKGDGRQAECTSANVTHWTDLSLHTRNAQLSRPPWRGAIRPTFSF